MAEATSIWMKPIARPFPVQMPLVYIGDWLFVSSHRRMVEDDVLGQGAGSKFLSEYEVGAMEHND